MDYFHCFLLGFAYVHGGVLELQAPFLPKIARPKKKIGVEEVAVSCQVASEWRFNEWIVGLLKNNKLFKCTDMSS